MDTTNNNPNDPAASSPAAPLINSLPQATPASPDSSLASPSAGIPQPKQEPQKTPPDVPPGAQPPHHKGTPMVVILLLLIFSFFCGLALAAWYFQTQLQKVSPSASVTQTPVAAPKQLVIGTDATFQPMEYVNKEGGLIGYDIDLGYRIANDLGVKAEFKNIPWDNLFKALDSKEVDMVMSAVTVTDERKQLYDFSEPYLIAGQVIITKKENTTITTAAHLQGKRIAVQQGTTNEKEALKHTSETLVTRYPDFVQATKALVDGKVDAILSDLPGAKGTITANPTLKIASDPFTNENYAIVFRKGDPNVKKINEILAALRVKGILTDLKQKWLD